MGDDVDELDVFDLGFENRVIPFAEKTVNRQPETEFCSETKFQDNKQGHATKQIAPVATPNNKQVSAKRLAVDVFESDTHVATNLIARLLTNATCFCRAGLATTHPRSSRETTSRIWFSCSQPQRQKRHRCLVYSRLVERHAKTRHAHFRRSSSSYCRQHHQEC
jgi:hypothetical protein